MFLDYNFKSSNYFYILVDGPRTSGDLAEHLRSTSWTTQEPIGNSFMFRHVFKDHVPFTTSFSQTLEYKFYSSQIGIDLCLSQFTRIIIII